MRALLVLLHRWAGLLIAGFLFVSGVTGAIISWDHELDEWLNPHLNYVHTQGPARDPLLLAKDIEARHPQVQVTSLPLAAEAGHALAFWVEPKVDPATGKLFEPGFNQVFVDPASGTELGRREWGAVWPVNSENVVSFLYKLHYSLHIPFMAGSDRWGIWLLGIVALIWTVDCFTGFLLTLPMRRLAKDGEEAGELRLAASPSFWQRWKPAWKVRWASSAYKLNFDLHRAGSLWTWGLLFILAFTAFSLNLYREVFFPAMSLVSEVTPSPYDQRQPVSPDEPIAARVDMRQTLALASQEAVRRGWREPAGSIYYSREYGIYGVAFYHPEDGHGAGGVGHRTLYLDSGDGRVLGDREPWKGTAADIFVQAQFPLHSGRILGIPGRILISFMGLVVAMLSVTGVYVWWKKRAARRRSAPQRSPAPAGQLDGLAAARVPERRAS
jgi:uncharacterized iron-regulated membrane protein